MSNTIVNKKRKRQLNDFIDKDHSVTTEYYEIIDKDLSDAELLKKMQTLIEKDQDFYDPYLIIADILFFQDKDEESRNIVKNAYERAVARISDAQGRWPRVMPWGFLENRHLMRTLEYYADNCWEDGKLDEALDIYRRLLHVNPTDNQGARYSILAIRMGLGFDDWDEPFEAKNDKGEIIGLSILKLSEWFHDHVKNFPDEFDWFTEWHKKAEEEMNKEDVISF